MTFDCDFLSSFVAQKVFVILPLKRTNSKVPLKRTNTRKTCQGGEGRASFGCAREAVCAVCGSGVSLRTERLWLQDRVSCAAFLSCADRGCRIAACARVCALLYAFARPASTLPAQHLFRARLVVLVWIRKHVFESYRLNRSGARTSAPSVRFLRSALLASQKAPLGSTSALAAVPSRGHQLHVTRRRPRTVAPVSARARRARNVGCGSLVLTGPGIGTVNMGDRVHKNTRPGRASDNVF